MTDDIHEFTGMGDEILNEIRKGSKTIVSSLHELMFYSLVGRRIRDPNSKLTNQFLNIVDVYFENTDEAGTFKVIMTVLHPNGKEQQLKIVDPFALFEIQEVDDEGFVFDYWASHGVDATQLYGQQNGDGPEVGECNCDGCTEIRNMLVDFKPDWSGMIEGPEELMPPEEYKDEWEEDSKDLDF